jgi:hypothetical protein
VFGAYDDTALEAFVPTPTSPFLQSGFYTGVSADLSYAWQGQRVQIGANGGTAIRHYQGQGLVPVGFGGGFGLSAEFARRTRLFVNQSIAYSPAYMYGVFPELGLTAGQVVGQGDPLSESQVYIYDTTANITRGISRRGSVEFLSNIRYSDFDESTNIYTDLLSWSVGGRYRQGITRYTQLRLGYIYRKGSYGFVGAARPTVLHDIDVGVDYNRALSLTRRTTFDFGVGSTIVNYPVGESSNQLQFRVAGAAGLNHQMGRTWQARLAYNHGIGFAEAFAQPIFSDAVTASLTGFFSRRVDFTANTGYSMGDVGVGTGENVPPSEFKAFNALVRVRVALGRPWALYGEYQYFNQDLGEVLIVPDGVPRDLGRNTVSAGLTFWIPVWRR